MRSIVIAAIAALAFAGAANAAAGPPYKMDRNGFCQDAEGTFVAIPLCAPKGYAFDLKGRCHGPDGRHAKTALCKGNAPPAPHCAEGRRCGDVCLKATQVCHKP